MPDYTIETRTLPELETAVEFATLSPPEIGPWLQKAFGEVATYLERKGARRSLASASPAMAASTWRPGSRRAHRPAAKAT